MCDHTASRSGNASSSRALHDWFGTWGCHPFQRRLCGCVHSFDWLPTVSHSHRSAVSAERVICLQVRRSIEPLGSCPSAAACVTSTPMSNFLISRNGNELLQSYTLVADVYSFTWWDQSNVRLSITLQLGTFDTISVSLRALRRCGLTTIIVY